MNNFIEMVKLFKIDDRCYDIIIEKYNNIVDKFNENGKLSREDDIRINLLNEIIREY